MEGSGDSPEDAVIRSVENITAAEEPLLTGEATTEGPGDVVTTRGWLFIRGGQSPYKQTGGEG